MRFEVKKKEDSSESGLLKLLYETAAGNIALSGLVRPSVSDLAGRFCDSGLSKRLIPKFIRSANIDMSEYEDREYRSFNEFFTRKIRPDARPIDMRPESLVSPCDSKLTVYPIDEDSIFEIKGVSYHVDEFLKSERLAERYNGGFFAVFRLEVSDYHRYMYIDNGFKSRSRHIRGKYHTVNPIALERTDIYRENTREYAILDTENFGKVIQCEVGAMLVGKISNHNMERCRFKRGEEKGMFEYGGSTIVLLFQKDTVEFDDEIIINTAEGFETIVKMGMKIGRKKEK